MVETAPLALVTGSSTGIGSEIAVELARRGYQLVLCADEDHTGVRDRLAGAPVAEVRADLATAAGVEELLATLRQQDRPLDVAALNAGAGQAGDFLDADVEQQLAVVRLDVLGTLRLAHAVLGDMRRRGAGRVLVTSSVVSALPGAQQATYNASKAFLQSWCEAVQHELRGSGVTLTSLRPGATESRFWDRAGLRTSVLGRIPKADPALPARRGVEALLAGERSVVTGTLTGRLLQLTGTVTPPRVKAALQSVASRPR